MTDKTAITRQVIARAKKGDPAATSLIYQVYAQMIYRYVAYRVGSDEDAEDITSDVFVRMVKDLPRYNPTGAPFEAWLYRIAATRIADFYRKTKRTRHVELTENVIHDVDEPEQRVLEEQEANELREAMSQLSETDQEVLILRFVERKSHQEVAKILDKSVTAVKSIQHRALIRLASHLGSEAKVRHYLRGRS